jgi:hypothetical protein
MSSSNTTSSSGGIGTIGLLGVVFIVLKLTGVIAWPWLWVLAPFWISIALGVIAIAVFAIVVAARS